MLIFLDIEIVLVYKQTKTKQIKFDVIIIIGVNLKS